MIPYNHTIGVVRSTPVEMQSCRVDWLMLWRGLLRRSYQENHVASYCQYINANMHAYLQGSTLALALCMFWCHQGWVQIHILGSNTKTTQPNQIQIHCFSRFQFKYKCSIQIQIHCHFLFKYDSNTLPFLKFDSNMIKIHGLCFCYNSSVSQWVSDINCLKSLDRMFVIPAVWSTVGRQH